MSKVILLNGSPHANGCTATALNEMIKVFQEEGIETELIHVGNKSIRGCISCNRCSETGKCVFDDLVNEVAPKFAEADGLVVGSPVYYASPNGTILSFMDRLFYSICGGGRTCGGQSCLLCKPERDDSLLYGPLVLQHFIFKANEGRRRRSQLPPGRKHCNI